MGHTVFLQAAAGGAAGNTLWFWLAVAVLGVLVLLSWLAGLWFGELRGRQKGRQEAQENLEVQAHTLAEKHTQQAKISLDAQLKPFEKELKELSQNTRLLGHTSDIYRQQLEKICNSLSSETKNLTQALRGDVKTQGDWGEMILERILEASGLRQGEEYILQGKGLGLHSQQGGALRPDAVVLLPEKRCLVIDAKVSLKHYAMYQDAVNNNDPAAIQTARENHAASVQSHVKNLAARDYTQADLHTPQFVFMFMPNESAYILAQQAVPQLFEQTWEKQVVLVSPTILLVALRMTASIWQLERQNANAQEIARQASNLYDKFVDFVDDVKLIGEHALQGFPSPRTCLEKTGGRQGQPYCTSRKTAPSGCQPQETPPLL